MNEDDRERVIEEIIMENFLKLELYRFFESFK